MSDLIGDDLSTSKFANLTLHDIYLPATHGEFLAVRYDYTEVSRQGFVRLTVYPVLRKLTIMAGM